jgi:hypothetical protein
MKAKNPGTGKSLYDLVLNALDESHLGRVDFKGAEAYEIARRIHRIDNRFSDYDIEQILEELVKTGLVKKITRFPIFFKEMGRNLVLEKSKKTSSK